MYSITINGVDRTSDIVNLSPYIQDVLNDQQNTCDLQLIDRSGNGIPANDEEIIITLADGTILFGGYIVKVDLQKREYGEVVAVLTCVDYSRLLDRNLVHDSYEDMTDKEIIEAIIATYCPGYGITTTNVIEGVTISQITFNYLQPSQCFRKIAELTGRNWYIDYEKDIHYFPLATSVAPFDIRDYAETAYSYLGQTSSTSTLSEYTFSSRSLGEAADDRYILALVSTRKTATTGSISSITIGGVTATILSQVKNTTGSNNSTMAVAIALVPSGTTGDVVVTMDMAFLRCAIGLYRLTDIESPTPYDLVTSQALDPTNTLNIPANGFAIGGSFGIDSSTCSWTGLTEDFDVNFQTNGSHTGASKESITAESGLTIIANWSASSASIGIFLSFERNEQLQFENLKISKDASQLKNRVYVRGGTELSDTTTYSTKGDGVMRQFILPDKPHDVTVTVNGSPQTVGIKNVNLSGYDWYLNFQEKYIEQDAAGVVLATTDTFVMTYKYDVPILVAVEDTASIAESGVHEFAIFEKSIATTDAARARANAELTDYANNLIEGSFDTYSLGFRTGQYIHIDRSDYDVDADYIVQRVTAQSEGAGNFKYSIELASAKTMGIIKFLIELLEANKNLIELDPNEVIDELFLVSDSLLSDSLTDNLTIDSSGPYFTWCVDSLDSSPITRARWDLFSWG